MDIKVKLSGLLLSTLIIFSTSVQALECDVEYTVKKVTEVKTWYGTIEQPEYDSGERSGRGKDRTSCLRNALRPLQRRGWKVTFSKIVRVY